MNPLDLSAQHPDDLPARIAPARTAAEVRPLMQQLGEQLDAAEAAAAHARGRGDRDAALAADRDAVSHEHEIIRCWASLLFGGVR